jgi:hypothetical protein
MTAAARNLGNASLITNNVRSYGTVSPAVRGSEMCIAAWTPVDEFLIFRRRMLDLQHLLY